MEVCGVAYSGCNERAMPDERLQASGGSALCTCTCTDRCLHARSCEGTDVGIYDREAGQAQPRLTCAGTRATKRLVVVVAIIVLLLLCIVTLGHGKERHPLHHRHHIKRAVSPVDRAEALLFHCFFVFCVRPSCLTDETSCAPAA